MCQLRNSAISIINPLCPLLGELVQLYEVEIARDERVSGQRRRFAVERQLRDGGSGRTSSATKGRATVSRFPLSALSRCQLTIRNQIEGITSENAI